jgi:hypothetical protein
MKSSSRLNPLDSLFDNRPQIVTREGIDNSYVSRMVNLTTLAPDIVAAILDDALPNHITLFDLAVDPPALWDEQRERINSSRYSAA